MVEGDKYEVLEKIGHGSFGIIRKVRRRVDGQVLCRKEINYVRMSQKEREQLHAEFAILSSLRHPNIVGYYHREHLKTTQDLHLYMEYCGNGDLGRVIKELQVKKQYAEESFVWSMFSQLVTALYRCHYGLDPPEVGSNVMGLSNTARPRTPSGGVMILHRDLKPENVFLGEDNSVKLGDFGLSKIMQSHDFASTYVGTPFYMSPEICAAERYTLKSDIWSLGCIIYELCAREPPFNAKSHFQLVQKIKEGKIAPLPSVYSPDLMKVINDCLRVNPDKRPDTATLLNLPVVKLMRKEKEVVELSRMLKTKEEAAARLLLETEAKLKQFDTEKRDIDAALRREWEVKARLEIDRQVQIEVERLNKQFETEVKAKVEEEVQKIIADGSVKDFSSSLAKSDIPLSSVSTCGDEDISSSTDLTELSMDSPEPVKPVKGARTPFSRAQTMFNMPSTPMDIEMGEPSPMSIASLSLSPRRHAQAKPLGAGRNIFATANVDARERWQPTLIPSDDEDDDDGQVPSPTRSKAPTSNPFKAAAARPALGSQRTAPVQRPSTRDNIFATAKQSSASTAPTLQKKISTNSLKEKSSRSPSRRLSKTPSSTSLASDAAEPLPSRMPSFSRKNQSSKSAGEADGLNKLAIKNNMALKAANSAPKGRTLVELAQARAGGRPVDMDGEIMGSPKGKKGFSIRMVQNDPAIWHPERDEMPSPFLIKHRPAIKR